MSEGATPIEFEVGGEVYPVAFTTNALCSLEDEFGGASIARVGEMIAAGAAGVRGARALFRAALVSGHPAITPVAAGKLMEELGPDRSAEIVQEAFERLKAGFDQTVKLPSPDARGRLSFEAAGLRLVLAFTMNAQAEMETYFEGLKPEAIMARVNSDGAGLGDVRALFRAALVDHTETSFEEAGVIMDRIGIRVASEAVKIAYYAAFPKAEEDAGEEPTGEGNRHKRRGAAASSRRHPTSRPARASGIGKPS